MENNLKKAVIIGGGVAGIQSALDLADMGVEVHLIEKNPSIGGRMAQLDKTFPSNDCSICILAPKLSECARHPNITLHTLSEVNKVNGNAGNFTVEIYKKARYVKEDECVNCGACAEKCPMRVEDKFERGLIKRRAIYLYYLQGVPSVMTIDREHCLWFTKNACRICEKICDRNAIDFDQKDEIITIDNVGAIIVATGFDVYEDINKLITYGYKKYRNVVTSLEFERLLSASGPQEGHLRRFSDNKEPKKIAFLQCIGSREVKGKNYCSSICCMYTTKEAMIAHEHNKELKSYIFYIDLRAGGKGFQKFINRGAEEYNISYIKSKIASIDIDKDENLIITFEDIEASEIKQLTVDMVVLATCVIAPSGINKLASILGIELDENNFIRADPFIPVETSREGIFTCGCSHEPMDIPRSVAEASAAAAKAAEIIRGG
ncbi:MAG: FAD-dependent oxidoreductase [Promethearchaeota archaeon]